MIRLSLGTRQLLVLRTRLAPGAARCAIRPSKARAHGAADHEAENEALQTAATTERASGVLLVIGCFGLVLAALLLVLSR